MQSDTLEERYAIKLCFKLEKTATEMNGMIQTTFGPSCLNRASVFEWHKRLKKGRGSVRDEERCGRSEEVNKLHKRSSMGPSRSCWNDTSALQLEEITSKGTRVSCVYNQ